jgi:hypothetical protein
VPVEDEADLEADDDDADADTDDDEEGDDVVAAAGCVVEVIGVVVVGTAGVIPGSRTSVRGIVYRPSEVNVAVGLTTSVGSL